MSDTPRQFSPDDSREVRELKQIVNGMREEAFAILREREIRPIKVVAADGSKANGEVIVRGVRSHEDVIRFFVQRQRTEAQLRRQLVERLGQAPKAELERRRREVSEMIETLGFQPLD